MGLIQPIVVYPKGERYELLDGQRRFLAHKDELKWSNILAMIIEEPEKDMIKRTISWLANEARLQMTTKDKMRHIVHMYSEGWKIPDIAEDLVMKQTEVSAMIKLPRVPDVVRQAVEAGEIDADAAVRATDAKKFVKGMGLELDRSLDQLREFSSDEIIEQLDPRTVFGPMIDGTLIPDHAGLLFAQGKQHDVPFLIGGNSWEASLGRQIGGGFSPKFISKLVPNKDKDILYPGLNGEELEDQVFGDLVLLSTGRYMANQMEYVDSKTYHYHFSYVASEKVNQQPGAAHSDDIAFVMKTLGVELNNVSEKDKQISNSMHNYWVQFAKTGDPNVPGQTNWTAYNQDNGSVLEIGDTIVLRNDFLNERINYHINRGTDFLQSMTKQ